MDFTYDSVRQRLIDRLRSKASWGDILFFSANSRMVDSVSEAIAEFAGFDEHLSRQTKWDLANDKSALTSHAHFMQYEPHRKIGASGTIRVSVSETFDSSYSDNGGTDNIVFPKYTVFTDEAGEVKFSTTSTQVMGINDDYLDLDVIQGEPKTFSYIADGETGIYEEISVENDSIENVLYEVLVNGENWDETKDLNANGKDDKVFQLENKLNFDGVNIIFGNNIFGKELEVGASVIFKYLETLGILGNILGVGVINTVESTIYDSNISPNTVDIYCTNLSNLDGGNDEEDIEDIRTNGINTFQAGDKAVAQKDYKVKLEESPYVYKATVWGAFEYNLDNNVDLWTYIPTEENIVHVSAFTPAGEQLTDSQKTEIITYIKEDKPPTDIVQFSDVNFIYVWFTIQAYVEDVSYALSVVKSDIETKVEDEFGLTHRDFREPLYETDWKGFINEIDGVTYHSSYLELAKYEKLNEEWLGDLNLDIFPIKKESIYIYIKDTSIVDDPYVLIGIDDGTGIFTGQNGYDLTGSSINYSTGEGVLNIVDGVWISGNFGDKKIKVIYKPDSINTELNGRNQIFKIENIDVSADYILD